MSLKAYSTLVLFLEVIGVGRLFTSLVRNRLARNPVFTLHPASQVNELTTL
jgi:hypothetical protein